MSQREGPLHSAASAEPVGSWAATFSDWWSRAFAVVYNRLRQRLDAELAEEVLIDALAAAWHQGEKQANYFSSFAHFCNWVRQTAAWRANDALRRKSRQRSLSEEEEEALPDSGVAEARLRLQGCLDRLPEDERLLLAEHYEAGKTDIEVGQRLFGETAPLQALGLRTWRLRQKALAHLRQILLAENIGPEHWHYSFRA